MKNLTINLWEASTNLSTMPTLELYLLSGDKKRPLILICPGGGYTHVCDREGEPIAFKFTAAGFHAAVLNYRVSSNHPDPILDASKAMTIIRENAENWNIISDKIALCGFSAGGHLAASVAVHWDKPYLQKFNGLNKPNALILCYPVITSGEYGHKGSFEALLGFNASEKELYDLSLEEHVTENTARTFIWHTFEDAAVPVENTLLFANALRKNKVPFELHIYPEGPHGMALATKETVYEDIIKENAHIATWMPLCIQWLDSIFK